MDGVISDFDKAAQEQGNGKRPDLYVNYRNLELMPYAKESLIKQTRSMGSQKRVDRRTFPMAKKKTNTNSSQEPIVR